MKEQLNPYPFTEQEPEENVRSTLGLDMQELLKGPLFDRFDRDELYNNLLGFFNKVNGMFDQEEGLRKKNVPGANLYYHGRHHGIFQATRDAIMIMRAICSRNDKLSGHLTAEGVLAGVGSTMNHDSGHVNCGHVENYAARSKIHVEESKKVYSEMIDSLPLPEGLNKEKIKRLGILGIHGTYFPFTRTRDPKHPEVPHRLEEAKKLINDHVEQTRKEVEINPDLTPEEREWEIKNAPKEAHIILLSVQLADLGGQCARPDYFPDQLKNLRAEMNEITPGLGTDVVGDDHELEEKRELFIKNYVEIPPPAPRTKRIMHKGKEMYVPEGKIKSQAPRVGITLSAFFGEEKSKPFRDAWLKKAN